MASPERVMIASMQRLAVTLPLAASLFAVGCSHDGGPRPDSAVPLGARGELGYHLRAGAASEVPSDAVGFVVTANGQGGYRIAWVAFDGQTQTFSGSVTSDGSIDPTSVVPYSGREQIEVHADGSEIDFSSVPGSSPDGVDFVPSADPIYVDLRVDGAPAQIYFTGAETSRLYASELDPVAFTSP
jgi:hypothetical protein